MKVELLDGLDAGAIKEIWFKYHEERSKLCDILTVSGFLRLLINSS
jgi:hypothetical protein